VKLNLRNRYSLHTLVINGAMLLDVAELEEQALGRVLIQPGKAYPGLLLGAHVLPFIIGIESNKPEAIAALKDAAKPFAGVEVVKLPARYPMGSEKHLVQTLTGRETPARGLTADIGVVVHNPATAFAVHEALRHGSSACVAWPARNRCSRAAIVCRSWAITSRALAIRDSAARLEPLTSATIASN